jgi:hypothetical protein
VEVQSAGHLLEHRDESEDQTREKGSGRGFEDEHGARTNPRFGQPHEGAEGEEEERHADADQQDFPAVHHVQMLDEDLLIHVSLQKNSIP